MNKKGMGLGTILGIIIVLFLLWWFLFGPNKIIKDGTDTITNAAQCENSVAGKGTCRATCEQGETVKIKLSGCGENNWCCINPLSDEDKYGPDPKYNFWAYDIGTDDTSCKRESGSDPTQWIYVCTKETVKIKMTIENLANQDLTIFANPKVNEEYPVWGTPELIQKDEKKTMYVDVQLKDKNTEYKIYAAAKCNTGACLEKDPKEGVFKIYDKQYIILKRQ